MSYIKVIFNDDNINAYIDDTYIGNIMCSINSYHNSHYYLKLQLQHYDTGVAKEVYKQLDSVVEENVMK